MKSSFLTCAAFILCVCSGVWQLPAQTDPVSATVQFGDGETATVTDFSSFVGVHPSEFVGITVQFPAATAGGKPVIVQAVDGGSTSVGASLPVANPDGSFGFNFLATSQTGRNELNIRIGSTSVSLQLWVIDPNNAKSTPSKLTAVSHNY